MGSLESRVAIVTGAGRGLGRAHALFLAAEGALVVVNDLGGDVGGGGQDSKPAEQVVDEIRATGGKAVASGHNVADWDEAKAMIRLAVDTFGDLHVLVNNAGIVRDRTLANMSELDWDAVVNVHLKGHAAPTSHALAYWRRRAHELGSPVRASIIHTSSLSGLVGNFGQANYSAVKLGVVALSRVASLEGGKYGVRSNAVSPSGRTRIAMTVPSIAQRLEAPRDPGEFDPHDPANVSPLIAWLAHEDCPANAQIFHVGGDRLLVFAMPPVVHQLRTNGRWTLAALDRDLPARLVKAPTVTDFLQGGD